MHRKAPCTMRWAVLLWLNSAVLLAACSGQPVKPPAGARQQVGLASYYAQQLQGRVTASGERYDRKAFTAAHRELPFGTVVQVVHLSSGRSVRVRINDRGPFVNGRIIDLSHAAAEQLKIVQAGVVKVRVTVIEP
jgi:rare lipoprotein A